MSDPLNLKKHIREVKDFPIEGNNFRDITSGLIDDNADLNHQLMV